MKNRFVVLRSLALLLLAGVAAHAAPLLQVNGDFLTAADPTQLGRLSRNGVPQDWVGSEPYPGVINTTTTYRYTEYVVNASVIGPSTFIQIEFDSVPVNTFVSAFDTSYHPANPVLTWLGDAGTSGNFFGTDPLFFQVIIPAGHNLDVVVNTVSTDAASLGAANAYNLTVEGFVDTNFTDVPEPSSILLIGSGILVASLRLRRVKSLKNNL
jgi:hypothetical protein